MIRLLPVRLTILALAVACTSSAFCQYTSEKKPIEPNYQWDKLHPAFRIDAKTALQIFEKGQKDALAKKGFQAEIEKVKKTISVSTVPGGPKEDTGWLYGGFAPLALYLTGFDTQWKYMAEPEVDEVKARFNQPNGIQPHVLPFFGSIVLNATVNAKTNLVEPANPRDLSDVRVVMKVDDKVYQPAVPMSYPSANIRSEAPLGASDSYIEKLFEIPEVLSKAWGKDSLTSINERVSPFYYIMSPEKGFKWYAYRFGASFDLFNPDGTPRITPKNKEVTIIVVYGQNSYEAVYKLDDIAKIGR